MRMPDFRFRLLACLLPLVLAACGSGDDEDCSVAAQKSWLSNYMNDWYFWYRLSPRPDPAGFSTVNGYFDALLYTGTDPTFPKDRWSFSESTETFNRFFGDGQSLGWGVAVNGLEAVDQPGSPLYVRYIEPQSPAALAGVARGDQVVSVNGRAASELVAANDFSALSATASGQTLTLVLRRNGTDRTVSLRSAVFTLTPVNGSAVVTSPLGRKMGYVIVKDMISQAEAPLEAAFTQFRQQGVTEIVLDMRYNGGGLVSTGARVASLVAGTRGVGKTYASLLYNDKRAADNNSRFQFGSLAAAAGVARVFVLAGERTCSASEQVINGLRGVGVDVVAIGGTTCGKPVGFLPAGHCGTTYNAVNFESVNDRNEGRYFDGFAPTCPVAEDFTQALGTPTEALLATARQYADSGACPAVAPAQATKQPLSALQRALHRAAEPGERQGMVGR